MAAGDDQGQIHNAADAADTRLTKELLATFGVIATAAFERSLLAALVKRQLLRTIALVRAAMAPATAIYEARLANELLLLESRTFTIGAETLGIAEMVGHLNLTNPEAVAFAQTRSSRFVAQLDADTQQMLRMAISSSFIEGIPPRETAELIRRSIGLTANQAAAVGNYRGFLQRLGGRDSLDALPSSVRERVARSDIRILPKRGAGMTEDRVEKMVEKYRNRLLNERALALVRTETMSASNQGQLILWNQAVDRGLLNATTVRKKFIITRDERTCPICRPMAGQVKKLDEEFVSPYNGARSTTPPLHFQCRCTMGLVRVREKAIA